MLKLFVLNQNNCLVLIVILIIDEKDNYYQIDLLGEKIQW